MAAMGAGAEKAGSLVELQAAMARARASGRSYGIVIETDPLSTTQAGGHWWDVVVPEVSGRPQVNAARVDYETALTRQRRFD